MTTDAVRAHWDDTTGVWWAESDGVPGGVAEAETVEVLRNGLRALISGPLRLNADSVAPDTASRLPADRAGALRPA